MGDAYPKATLFLTARGVPATAADEALEASLARMLEDGETASPFVPRDVEGYVRYVAARAPSSRPDDLARLHAADLYLARACMAGDAGSIAAFDLRFLSPLPKMVARKGIALDVAEEVVQSLRARLFVGKDGSRALLGDYDGRGALGAWVRVAAVRSASKVRRDEDNRAAILADAASQPSIPLIDPALAVVKRRYREAFEAAIGDAFATLAEEDRNVLRLHFMDGLNLEAIGRVLGLSRATVGRRLQDARERVREEILRLLGERIAATPTELVSLLGVVRSGIDVSFAALVT